MIPKKIHYCWLSDEALPPLIARCMDTWRTVLPDYELVEWNQKRFDVDSVPWVREAVDRGRWAFAADCIRQYALYTEGGIYLDTDFEVMKPFDDLLAASRCFCAIETDERVLAENVAKGRLDAEGRLLVEGPLSDAGLALQAAAFGGEAGHPFFRRCLDWYESHHFVLEDGTLYDRVLAPDIMAYAAVWFGLRFRDVAQYLAEGMRIYPSTYVGSHPGRARAENYGVHHCYGSWRLSVKTRPGERLLDWWKRAMRRLGLDESRDA